MMDVMTIDISKISYFSPCLFVFEDFATRKWLKLKYSRQRIKVRDKHAVQWKKHLVLTDTPGSLRARGDLSEGLSGDRELLRSLTFTSVPLRPLSSDPTCHFSYLTAL